MKLKKGQVITFVERINNQFVEGSKWIVDIASAGKGKNAILIKLKKNGGLMSINNPINLGAMSEENAKILVSKNFIAIQ